MTSSSHVSPTPTKQHLLPEKLSLKCLPVPPNLECDHYCMLSYCSGSSTPPHILCMPTNTAGSVSKNQEFKNPPPPSSLTSYLNKDCDGTYNIIY